MSVWLIRCYMNKIQLKHKQRYSLQVLLENLLNLNYRRVPMVLEPGEFSVRGNVVDIYPAKAINPVRIEYDLDYIDRMSSFFAHNQRSVSTITTIELGHFDESYPFHKFKQQDVNHDERLVSQFRADDYIVHENHGIGLYKGLSYRTFGDIQGEYIEIEYKNNDRIFVPLSQLNIIHSYKKSDESTQLDSLTGTKWKTRVKKAIEDASKLSEELFIAYQERSQAKGFAFSEDTVLQLEVENEFEHPLTDDQKTVLADIKRDMESDRPMERLLCGDVGYGKTEVLVRAALKALENNKQVAVLVPTTILAEQHYKTFKKRLKNTPYIIKCLSRFYNKKEQSKAVEELENAACDLVIGTHRLLSKDIVFFDLGLLIIDEEQRFGVKHKEHLKQLKSTIDCISVSATPIPRTLYQSISGAKDCSLIKTPPKLRRPVLTTVQPFNEIEIEEAIHNEMARGGQLFYVYNKVISIDKKAKFLKKLCPNCRIAIVHGQMPEGQIKQVLQDFLDKKCDLLLSSTIIENGIDIPNANAIIIDEAENYGLSQIHQLRGRVGRSSTQAYAYLFYTKDKQLQQKAIDRLEAIREYVALGSGHDLALKDLEIRGAGNVLGKEQHGHIISVGFNLYCKLINEAISEKLGRKKEVEWLDLDANFMMIPESYISDPRQRVALYIRFYKCISIPELQQIKEEIEDRYGKITEEVKQVFDYVRSGIYELSYSD